MTHPSVNSIVERRKRFNRWFVENHADPDHKFSHMPSWLKADLRKAWDAATAEAATIISELQAEVEDLRKYCSAAANDYHGMLVAMERTIVPTLAEAFKSTAKELRETSEFMRLAAEGRASGLIYDDELSKAKSKLLAAESSLSRIKEETIEECAKVAEMHVSSPEERDADSNVQFHEGRDYAAECIASAIRSLDKNCSGKMAESGHSAPTRERE